MREVSESKKFLYFAFRQLPRVPAEWRSHYRYELVNAVKQWDPAKHPNSMISSRPLYWQLKHIKRGYHGVKWVLSRFDLDCPPIPEMYRDEDAEIETNEGVSNVFSNYRQRERFFSADDEFLKPRTISEAESLLMEKTGALSGRVGVDTKRYADVEPLGEALEFMESAFPHRMLDPQDYTVEDLEDEAEAEATSGGSLLGTGTGYPAGFGEGEAERDPASATWHGNFSVTPDRKAVVDFAESSPVSNEARDRDRWVRSMERREREAIEKEQGHVELRWVRGDDGRWVRKAQLPPPPAEGYSYPPPPGIAGNDY
eukprot:TRINITY_DN88_c1_g2_i1.p1 TRINITY_DN88_c1_g2~~TRINITY_DN88_c1_g2_i1.p1  ORF type:complete len:313 (+),score=94.87 TRINITY_DN88_c1_g2_i1:152-1090(+)